MDKPKIAQIIAVLDIVLGTYVVFYLCTLFFQGVNMIPGPLTHVEKVTRLVVYGICNYALVSAQIWMAIKLLLSARKVIRDEADQVKQNMRFRTWIEWSMIHLLILVLDAGIIYLLMAFSKRKLFALATIGCQIVFRLVGLIIISHLNIDLEDEISKV